MAICTQCGVLVHDFEANDHKCLTGRKVELGKPIDLAGITDEDVDRIIDNAKKRGLI